ncbi:MAG: CopD family protein [Terriglobia bacterium]|nr:CopD family protein [Terriglobia bacterium]
MIWFLRDYPLAAVLLRATTLAFNSLLIGGIVFCSALVPRSPSSSMAIGKVFPHALRLLKIAAFGLGATQILFVALDSAMLMSTGGLHLVDLVTANYFLAGVLVVFATSTFLILSRSCLPRRPRWLLFVIPLLSATVWTSHAASRLEDQVSLMVLTGLHQLAAAVWIGGMPYLWLLLVSQGNFDVTGGEAIADDAVVQAVRRYSTTALVSAVVLVAAGLTLATVYTESWSAVYGTAYGVVLIAKSTMLAGLLLLGAGNFLLIRKGRLHLPPALLRIGRFSEAEIGIGFTIILAAASLTAQPPGVDLVQNRLTLPEITARMTPHWPRLHTPPVRALPAVDPMGLAIRQYALSPDDARSANNRIEQAWSEYNHHWAGIVVLIAGLLAILGRWDRASWARHWPLAFLGLAIFLFLRADPEAWPLGPRSFWASFYNPEDLEHRLYILLIVSFVAFEWSVQTHRLQSPKASLVFPAVCALGGALLLTHNHSLGNVKEELLTEMSHTAIALCAVFAGWSRWLELRGSERGKRIAAWIWPICLICIGMVLLNYRES